MKPLSVTRKVIVIAAFLLGVLSTLYGYFVGNGWALRVGLYSFFGFVILFMALILPYWSSDPKLGPEINGWITLEKSNHTMVSRSGLTQ